MSLVVVGSVAYDTIETPRGKQERVLGGACTYIALSASFFTSVGIVAVVGEDFAETDREFLARRGIDLAGLEQKPGKTFHWAGVYAEDMNQRETRRLELNVFRDFDPDIPPSYRDHSYLMLGNIQPSLQLRVQQQMPAARLVAGDTIDTWIRQARPDLLQAMRSWDILLVNEGEARLLTGERNLRRAAARLLEAGPSLVVIKRGEYGAALFHRDYCFFAPAYPLEEVEDPTGAGDSFAGGFMGYLAERGVDLQNATPQELARAVIYGSVMGSFCCEQFGPARFASLTREEIDQRFREFEAFTRF